MPKDRVVSSPQAQSQYSVPTEQLFQTNGSGDTSYQTSEGDMGVYTSSQNSNSLVIGAFGQLVYSNPGSPKSPVLMMDTLKVHQRPNTSYCDSQLPLPVNSDAGDTVVIADDNHTAYRNAFANSNNPVSLVMSQMGGACDVDVPNEMCNSRNTNREKLHAILMNQRSFPIDPLQGADVYFRGNPIIGTDYSAGSHADSIDISALVDPSSVGVATLGQCVPPSEGGVSSMVTGVCGGGGGAGDGGGGLQDLTQFNQTNVFEDDFDTILRELTGLPNAPADVGMPDLDLLKFIDSGAVSDASVLNECLSTPVNADFINGFNGISIQPIQAQNHSQNAPFTPTTQPFQSSIYGGVSVQEQQSSIGDNLDIIKMMNVQLKPSPPASLGLKMKSNHMVPMGLIPSPLHTENTIPLSPAKLATPYTPYTPNPPTPIASVEASVPSPAPLTPQTPNTPCSTQKGPFDLNTRIEEDERVCEISVRSDLQPEQRQMALQMLCFSLDAHQKITECLQNPCDLKVAMDARAELCGLKCDQKSATLQFSMPKDCVHLDKWLCMNKDRIDLRDRQLVLQQVINLLADLHTIGNKDKLCLWGSFVVWVAPDKRVHLLVDFPEMLAKMEKYQYIMNFDPRIEDVKAINDLYQMIFCPFVNQDSSWVSPGVKHLTESFETLVRDPSSVYRMAELARNLGERRLCKLEVELMTLTHFVYCIEHEPLREVLSHVTSMVPPVACERWEVQWANTGRVVECDVIASAHRHMRLVVQPVSQGPTSFAVFSSPANERGLTFSSGYLSPF